MIEFGPDDKLFTGTSLLNDLFDCTTCGLCCMDFDDLPIYASEVEELASHLGLDKQDFKKRFTKDYFKSEGLETSSFRTPCRFLEDRKCMIYSHRPFICRFYPLVVNISTNEAVLSGIYFCPQATQLYEGLIEFYRSRDEMIYGKLMKIEAKSEYSSKGWELKDTQSLITRYLDWIYQS